MDASKGYEGQLTTTSRRKQAGIQKGRWASTLASHGRVRHDGLGVYATQIFEQMQNIYSSTRQQTIVPPAAIHGVDRWIRNGEEVSAVVQGRSDVCILDF